MLGSACGKVPNLSPSRETISMTLAEVVLAPLYGNAAYGYVHAHPRSREFSDYRIANNYVHDCGVETMRLWNHFSQAKTPSSPIISFTTPPISAWQSPAASSTAVSFRCQQHYRIQSHLPRHENHGRWAGMYLTFSQQDRTCWSAATSA